MKKILVILFLLFSTVLQGATYYVALGGSDINPGTINSPWATWQKGFNTAVAGDIVYIRGGVYNTSGFSGYGEWNGVYINGKGGVFGNPVRIEAYQEEVPILDCSSFPTNGSAKRGVNIVESPHITIKGLVVRNVPENDGLAAGFIVQSSNYITFERCIARYNSGPGFAVNGFSDYGYFIKCDSHHNEDYLDDGGFGDGFIASHYGSTGGYHTYFIECRAWANSDDGFDRYASDAGNKGGYITWENCWSWDNGRRDGNGAGFKWGATQGYESGNPIAVIMKNCLAFNNKAIGIDQSECEAKGTLYNNVSYKNGSQGFYNNRNTASIFRNNISYANVGSNWVDQTNFTDDHNTWNGLVTVNSADFLSLDTAGVSGNRNEDGGLPILNFLKLQTSSDLVNAGTDVGIPYNGSAPDMGAFETGVVASTVPSVTTTDITNITATTATSGGNVYADGGESVTARGVCWSTSQNPTILNSKTTNGSGTGSYISYLISLTDGLTYYVRAYATNSVGTGYGNQRSFVAGTPPPPPSGALVESGGQFVSVGNLLIKN